MYDMYPWDQPEQAHDDSPPARPGLEGLCQPGTPGVQAVQVALDRRDNGGDAGPDR